MLILGYFPEKYYENLLLLTLHIIETDTWSLQEVWADVLVELAKRYPTRCLSEAFTLSAFSQKDSYRSIGGYTLAAVVEAQKGENCEDILRKIYSMTQDPSNLVRKTMCKGLYILLKVLPKKHIEAQLLQEAVKLVEDDCAEVLNSALLFFCDLMDCCGYHCKEEVIESFKSTFFTSQYSKLSHIKLKYIGKVMVSLRLGMDEEFRNMCLNWFCDFLQCKEPEITAAVAYNFPAILYIMGSMNDQLCQVFTELANDSAWAIQKTIAKQLGDVCKISNCKENELLNIVKSLCNYENTLEILVPQFFSIAQTFKSPEYFLDLLVKLLPQTETWRKIVDILKELYKFLTFFDCSSVLDKLFQVLMRLLKQESYPVRENSAKLLAEVFYKSLRKKEELSALIITQLGSSPICYNRISYIFFCGYLASIASHKLFCKYFLPQLFQLAKDPVADVVYNFALKSVEFRLALPFDDSEMQREFRGILNYFLETGDNLLVQCSISCDDKVDLLAKEFYSSAAEAKENMKIIAENKVEVREFQEVKVQIRGKVNRKATVAPRGISHNPAKRYSLGEIDKAELAKVIQKANVKKKVK